MEVGKLRHELANLKHAEAVREKLVTLGQEEKVREGGSWGFARSALGSLGRGGPLFVGGMFIIGGFFLLVWFGQFKINETLLSFVKAQAEANELMRRAMDEMRRR